MSIVRDLDGLRPTVATIDVGAFNRNIDAVVAMLPETSRLMVVLKADAYGHGAIPLAKQCDQRVAMIAVALLEEALELRSAGIETPLLTFGALSAAQVARAGESSITVGVPGPEALAAAVEASREGARPVIHLKLDSGMNRMGAIEDDIASVVSMLHENPAVRLEAIYTHLANASNPGDPFTAIQLQRFDGMLQSLREAGVEAPLHHVANSGATVQGIIRAGDFVRAGLVLFGGEPLDAGSSRLEPLMRWTTRIVRLKQVEAGEKVGYGTTFETTRTSRIATLPLGYADGYSRTLSGRGQVLINGRRAPLIGRVSMDLVTIDVTDLPNVRTGDEVVLLGRSGEDEISAEELADASDTISYEVFCRVSRRVPRVYVG